MREVLRSKPPLSALVVSKETGLPSSGFVAAKDVPKAFIEIFEHDWLAIPCPMPEQMVEATRARPSNGVPEAVNPELSGSVRAPL